MIMVCVNVEDNFVRIIGGLVISWNGFFFLINNCV